MKIAVIGAGFGDEGKGLITDYLTIQKNKSIVKRFSGGHQVGHTVVKDNYRHVFSNFGSGTLNNVPTFYEKDCIIDPINLVKELGLLQENGYNPVVYFDLQCPLVTPFDKYYNIFDVQNKKHGTTGLGYGATKQREENFYSLTVGDIFSDFLFIEKYEKIREYYKRVDLTHYEDLTHYKDFFYACNFIKNHKYFHNNLEYLEEGFENIIYEGSQGVLLDQHSGIFPHVTRSNLLNTTYLKDVQEICLVSRAYTTRHGNGPIPNEKISHNIKVNENETNIKNEYQGKFRRSLLDLTLLKYSIDQVKTRIKNSYITLAITCLDHFNEGEYKFTINDQIYEGYTQKEFIQSVEKYTGIDVKYISTGDTDKDVKEKVVKILKKKRKAEWGRK